jgi:hypothetical protein
VILPILWFFQGNSNKIHLFQISSSDDFNSKIIFNLLLDSQKTVIEIAYLISWYTEKTKEVIKELSWIQTDFLNYLIVYAEIIFLKIAKSMANSMFFLRLPRPRSIEKDAKTTTYDRVTNFPKYLKRRFSKKKKTLLFSVNIGKKRIFFSQFSHLFALTSGVKNLEISMKMSL